MTIHALPARLPADERVLWRGTPDWRGLARDALHLRGLSLYCGALVVYVGLHAAWRGEPAAEVALDTARAAAAAALPVLIGLAYAWFAARAATYTITNRRVVLRMGVALQMTMNLPFTCVDGADLRPTSGGLGEIRLKLTGAAPLSAFVLWPHARLGRTSPTLRALKDADVAGQVLARALAAATNTPIPLAPEAKTVETAVRAPIHA